MLCHLPIHDLSEDGGTLEVLGRHKSNLFTRLAEHYARQTGLKAVSLVIADAQFDLGKGVRVGIHYKTLREPQVRTYLHIHFFIVSHASQITGGAELKRMDIFFIF